MASNVLSLPYEYFGDPTRGRALFNAKIYVGEPDLDPETNPVTAYFVPETGPRVVAPQPIRTNSGGYIEYNGSVVQVEIDQNYSLRVRNRNDAIAFEVPNNNQSGGATIQFVQQQVHTGDSQIVGLIWPIDNQTNTASGDVIPVDTDVLIVDGTHFYFWDDITLPVTVDTIVDNGDYGTATLTTTEPATYELVTKPVFELRGQKSEYPVYLGGFGPSTADDTSSVQAALDLADGVNWTTIDGGGRRYNVTTVRPKQKTILKNVFLDSAGNGGSPDPIDHQPVLEIGDGLTQFDGFIADNVHIDGKRASYANIDIFAGDDGGMHGFLINGKVSNVRLINSSADYCGTAGLALNWEGAGRPSDPSGVAEYTIRDIKVVRCHFNWNREHGYFAAYFRNFKLNDVDCMNNGIDLPGGPWPVENGSHGAFTVSNGYFSKGFDIETYGTTSQFTEFQHIGGNLTNNANGSLQFFIGNQLPSDPNVNSSEANIVSRVKLSPPTVGNSDYTLNVEASNPVGGVYNISEIQFTDMNLDGQTRINGLKNLTMSGIQKGTVSPIKSVEYFNCGRADTSGLIVSSEMATNTIESPTLSVIQGTMNVPAISNTFWTPAGAGMIRVTYHLFITGAAIADEQLKFQASFANDLITSATRSPTLNVRQVSEASVQPDRLTAYVYREANNDINCLCISPGDNFLVELSVYADAGSL